MNLTIGNRTKQGISVRTRYIASIAGAALVASALLGAASWQDNRSSSRAATSVGQVQFARLPDPQQVRFYIVGTEAEKAAILLARDELTQFSPGWYPAVNIYVAGSPAADAFLHEGFPALMQAGIDFTVIDTTAEPVALPASAGQPIR